MSVRNETEIQLMKILFRNQKKKPTKNLTSRRAYLHGIEQKYYRQLKGFFKPLTDYVKNYLDKNIESLLHGDSEEIKLDAVPGPSFRNMIYSLEDWLSIYMPDISSSSPNDSSENLILVALGKTADETMEFGEEEFKRIIDKGIHVNLPTSAPWWEDMKNSWMEDNYTLITSNAKNYVSKINTLTEQAIINGLSSGKLKDEILKATESLSEKHCKLLARDQMGKLNGQITQAQMQEVGLDLYVWSTAFDDRVRDSHEIMEGLLCRWDDASVCSYDNGKTWQDRPSGAVLLHPGQDIQCRCVGLAFYPELIAEMEGTSLNEQTEGLNPVQELPEFDENIERGKLTKEFISDGLNSKDDIFKKFVEVSFQNTELDYCKVMRKIAQEYNQSINYIPSDDISGFNPANQIIKIVEVRRATTLRHETAHFFDYILGVDSKLHWVADFNYTTPYHFSFSKSKEFSSIYLNELKTMTHEIKKDVKKLFNSGELSPSASYLFGGNLSEIDIKNYLSYKGYKLNDEDVLKIQDMFTASTKKNFGGHPASYFKDTKRISNWPELKNESTLMEGFAELTESLYDKNLTSGMKQFLDDYFSDSISIIKRKVEEYIS